MRNLEPYRKLSLKECQSMVLELHNHAAVCVQSAAQLQSHLENRIWNELKSRTAGGKPRYTQDFRSFVAVYAARVREQFWEQRLYYAMKFEGVIYSGDDRRDRRVKPDRELFALIESRGQLMQDVDVEGAHLWVGTTINFTDWADINAYRKWVKP